MEREIRQTLRLTTRAVRIGALVVVSGLCALTSTADAAFVADTFTINDGTGTAAAQLHGVAAEFGGGTWSAGSGYEFTAAGTIFSDPSNTGGNGTRVGYLPYGVTNNSGVHTITALVRPPDTTQINGDDWAAIGFAGQSANITGDVGFFSFGVGQLWMGLRENGGWFVIQGPGTIIGQGGAQPGFNVSGLNPVELTYNSGTNKATAKVNGVTVLSNQSLTITPTIFNVGFHFHRPEFTQIDNFTAIPEPAALSLLGLGAACLMRRRV